ncbi:MAG TPA: PaaI family thioesterase [Acidimicrobiales bacterium]|nr:PaaI family thioesterase [Acidimicrobiales bacterium]
MTLPKPEFPAFDAELAANMKTADPSLAGGIAGYLQLRTVEVEAGRLVARLDVRDEMLNPFGTLHGGTLAALTDHVLGAVLYTVIDRGAWAATTEFKLNFLNPVRAGTVHAEAAIVSLTKRTAVVRIDIDNDGRAVAVAQGTVLIQPPRPQLAADAAGGPAA